MVVCTCIPDSVVARGVWVAAAERPSPIWIGSTWCMKCIFMP
jgi:hypothetical protein